MLMMFITGLTFLFVNLENVMLLIITLEYLVLSAYLLLLGHSSPTLDLYFITYFMIFAVCEGVLGISLLLQMSRSYGGDFLRGLSYT